MAAANDAPAAGRPSGDPRTRASRLAAVQALYEVEIADVSDLGPLLEDYMTRRWRDEDFREARSDEIDAAGDAETAPVAGDLARPRGGLLDELVRGTRANLADIDAAISGALTRSGDAGGLEALLRNILRAAVYELTKRPQVPARVCIDEYVAIAGSFYEPREERLVNGVLNTLARRIRPEEFQGDGGRGSAGP